MSKICSSCHADNRDDAQFCRACGTPFTAPSPPADAGIGLTCSECDFVNRPGVRYCAKCGVNLMGSVVVPRSRIQAPPSVPAAARDYPPSFIPPPPDSRPFDPLPFDPLPFDPQPVPDVPVPDVPDPQVAIDVQRPLGNNAASSGIGFGATPPQATPNRTPLWAGLGIAVVVAAGVAWWFLEGAPTPPRPASTQPMTPPTAAPEAQATLAPAVTAPAEPATTAAAPASSPEALPSAPVALPGAVAPAAEATAPGADAEPAAAQAEAQRMAAEKAARAKAAREKAARDRADREAKAKAANEQRDLAARQKAEQDAARKRAEDQQRARSQPVPTAPVAPVARPATTGHGRTVNEICAGRNVISKAICESSECDAPEHANEALCKQVRANQERRSQ